MPAKKPKPNTVSTISTDTVTLDLGYGAAPTTMYEFSSGLGSDTITFDTSNYSIGPLTSPTVSYSGLGVSTGTYQYHTTPNNVHIDADGLTMKEGSDIKIGGKSLTEAIDKIEQRLGILNPNPELENRWQQLKDLREQYMTLEKDLLEKEKIMKILKEA